MDVSVDDITPFPLHILMFLVLFMVSLNVFFILKKGFYVRVNCWFCNQNTKVRYSDRNSFECPHCEQYNGFNKDGGYNKTITAQYVNAYNSRKVSPRMGTSFNGLCNICNNNASLKVAQLAKYEPLNEKNYDIEIEHFKKQLEKTYKLCKPCQKHVNDTIKRQNAWLFANRMKNHRKFNILSSQGHKQDFIPLIGQLVFETFLLALTILIVLSLSGISISIYTNLTQSLFPITVNLTDFYNVIIMKASMNLENNNFTNYLPKTINISETASVTIIGFTLNVVLALFNGPGFDKFSELLSWIILTLTTTASFSKDALSYVHTLQIFSCVWLLYSYAHSSTQLFQKKFKRKFVLKKMSENRSQGEFSDVDDDSSIEDSFSSDNVRSMSNSNLSSSLTANKTPNNYSRLPKTASLLNIKLNNGRLTDQNNLKTARNSDLDKHFNDLNLGAFRQYSKPENFSQFRSDSVPQSNQFMQNYNTRPVSQTNIIANSFQECAAYGSNNHLGSPFIHSPKSNLFSNVQRSANAPLSTCGLPLASPNSDFTRQKAYTIPPTTHTPKANLIGSFQNNSAFKPISSCQSLGNMSTRSILSPPKFVNNFKANEELVFNVGVSNNQAQSNISYWPNSTSSVYRNFNSGLVNNFEQNQYDYNELSRSSSRSSGFMSGNEINSRAVSLPSSRSHSPEKSLNDHLKID